MKFPPFKLICLFAVLALATGCAGKLPVPGGSDTTNESFYDNREELLQRLDGLQPGMPESVVLQKLNRREGELLKLKREEIVTALLGTSNIEFKEGFGDQLAGSNLIQSLYGYRLDFQMVEREHGFSSPIRVRTDESGFKYSVALIFRDGRLFEQPVLSGGNVSNSSSKTIFDVFNPGKILDRYY